MDICENNRARGKTLTAPSTVEAKKKKVLSNDNNWRRKTRQSDKGEFTDYRREAIIRSYIIRDMWVRRGPQ